VKIGSGLEGKRLGLSEIYGRREHSRNSVTLAFKKENEKK
jgi:hypothetical protein